MRFAYVCTNYNNSGFTNEAVRSLLSSDLRPVAIVVVDNRSSESDREVLRRLQASHPEVEVLFNEANLGYFPGLNSGLRRLREICPQVEVIIVGNNDLIFPPEFAVQLEAKRGVWTEHAVVSPNILTLDGIHQNPHVLDGISWRRQLLYDIYHSNYALASVMLRVSKWWSSSSPRDAEYWQVSRPIYMGFGACYILGPRFLQQFVDLWAPTFLMGEEWFLSKQLRDVGQMIFYESGILVRHCDHASTGRVPTRKMWEYSRIAHRISCRHGGMSGRIVLAE